MEHDTFDLEIISTTKTEKHRVYWVELESPTGSFLVGVNHSPLVSIIKKQSKISYKNQDNQEFALEVYGGIFKVIDNKATAILDQ